MWLKSLQDTCISVRMLAYSSALPVGAAHQKYHQAVDAVSARGCLLPVQHMPHLQQKEMLVGA